VVLPFPDITKEAKASLLHYVRHRRFYQYRKELFGSSQCL